MMINLAILGSGSAGNAVCIEYKGESILIDAGFSGIELQRRSAAISVSSLRV